MERLPPGARVTATGRVYGLGLIAKHNRRLKLLAELRERHRQLGLCVNSKRHGKAWRAGRCRRCWRVKAAGESRRYQAWKAERGPVPIGRPRSKAHLVTRLDAAVVVAVQMAAGEWRLATNDSTQRTIQNRASRDN